MFAQRLKELRKLNGLSQAALSSLLGVTQQAVGKWETGRSTPDPQTVARLAEILDTPSDVLLGLRKEPGVSAAVGRNAFSRYTESQIPVVGTVRAGYGALAFEEDYGDLGVLVYGADGEGTLKKYIQRGNSVVLQPFNPAYDEMVIKGEELDHLYIAGKVVETKAKW